MALKDDTLGLGAKSGVNLPPTGLDAFQGLLGRLNGKQDEELEKEQNTRDNLKRAAYVENRWGALQFVSAGFLVGDRVKEVIGDGKAARASGINRVKHATSSSTAPVSAIESTKATMDPVPGHSDLKRKLKKSTKRKKNATEDLPQSEVAIDQQSTREFDVIPEEENANGDMGANSKGCSMDKEELDRRAEKAQRKLARRIRKEEKHLKSLEQAAQADRSDTIELQIQDRAEDVSLLAPTPSSVPPKESKNERHNVRSRYVQQKKMALMDPKALNEVANTLD